MNQLTLSSISKKSLDKQKQRAIIGTGGGIGGDGTILDCVEFCHCYLFPGPLGDFALAHGGAYDESMYMQQFDPNPDPNEKPWWP